MLWEVLFMLVILKIPVVYLCLVVWWAIRAEPEPLEGAGRLAPAPTGPDCSWRRRRAAVMRRSVRPRGRRPVGPPARLLQARLRVTP